MAWYSKEEVSLVIRRSTIVRSSHTRRRQSESGRWHVSPAVEKAAMVHSPPQPLVYKCFVDHCKSE
jgi:hypothetical protein